MENLNECGEPERGWGTGARVGTRVGNWSKGGNLREGDHVISNTVPNGSPGEEAALSMLVQRCKNSSPGQVGEAIAAVQPREWLP